MAPIPSVLPSATQETILSLTRKQKDILEFQIPRLRACSGPLVTQQQYAAELREDVDAFTSRVESLGDEVDELKAERSRRELRIIVQELQDCISRMRKECRSALLISKRVIDANKVSDRDELLRSSAVTEKQDLNEKVTEDALMETSNNVTEALQRTIALMQGELEKSVLSTQLLDASTAALKSTSSTHDVLDNLMVTSKHLITALEKSDWLDRMLILFALLFFILVVLFILKQRLIDRSLRIAFFWTRFLPSSSKRTITNVADVVEKGAGTSIISGVTTATSAFTSVAAAISTLSTSSLVSVVSSPTPNADNVGPSTNLLEPFETVVGSVPTPTLDTTMRGDTSEAERTTFSDFSIHSQSADVHTRDEL